MHGVPEGTGSAGRRVPRVWLALGVIFAGYIAFRLVQGVVWLVQHM
jgi:hypothetical protein